ncbi:MAG: hypothetical protein K5849_07460, partial [Bacteroidales bacterium]|nr:hypothetical protein [Bacteroidales bacterium]
MNDIALSLDTVWMLLAAILVFWMQPGFALCEAGLTRSKNTANILVKNFMDFILGSLLFFFVGFGFMFGSDGAGFIGAPNWGDLSFYKGDLPVEGFLNGLDQFIGIGSVVDAYGKIAVSAAEATGMLAYKYQYAEKGVINIANIV